MAALTIEEQLNQICRDLESKSEFPPEYRERVIQWVEKYGPFTSTLTLATAITLCEKKLGVRPQVGSTEKEVEPLVHQVFPTDGWLGEYMCYTASHEAPDLFHFWVGVAVICGAVRRSVFFEQGYYRVYPNIYAILVAPPGVCKKSTAANIGMDILQDVPGVNIIREKATPESLVKAMVDTQVHTQVDSTKLRLEASASSFIFAPELAVFMGKESYNEGLVGLLTTLFDCHNKWESMTITRGKHVLHNTHLCLLGATTPDLMSKIIPQSAFGGGFLSRIIFAVKDKTPRCVPLPVVRDRLQREQLSAKLITMSEMRGQVVHGLGGEEWMVEWYTKHHKRLQSQEDIALSGYLERKQDHLIKLSVVLLLSTGADLIITPEVYERALAILNHTERTMPDAFISIQTSDIGKDHERILKHMEKHGKMQHSQLLRKMYGFMDADTLRRNIRTLKEAGFVEEIVDGNQHAYILLRRRSQ